MPKDPSEQTPIHDLDQPLETQVEEKQQDAVEEMRDRWLRALAEGENLKKRLEKEKEDHIRYALFRFAKELLVLPDNLKRALESLPPEYRQEKGIEDFYQGVEITYHEVEKIFKNFGIEKIEALGKILDPHKHQVIAEKERDCEPSTVLEVLQEGYSLHERLLRPSLVVIAQKPTPSSS